MHFYAPMRQCFTIYTDAQMKFCLQIHQCILTLCCTHALLCVDILMHLYAQVHQCILYDSASLHFHVADNLQYNFIQYTLMPSWSTVQKFNKFYVTMSGDDHWTPDTVRIRYVDGRELISFNSSSSAKQRIFRKFINALLACGAWKHSYAPMN